MTDENDNSRANAVFILPFGYFDSGYFEQNLIVEMALTYIRLISMELNAGRNGVDRSTIFQ